MTVEYCCPAGALRLAWNVAHTQRERDGWKDGRRERETKRETDRETRRQIDR